MIPRTAVNRLALQTVLKENADAHCPISGKPVGEINHPVLIGKYMQDDSFVPSTNEIYEFEDLIKWMLEKYQPGTPLRSTDPMTREEISWSHVTPVQWTDPPEHLKDKPYVKNSVFHIGLNHNKMPLPDYYYLASNMGLAKHDFYNYYNDTGERIAFRNEMAWLSFCDMCPLWVAEYWRHHAYARQDAQAQVHVPNWKIIKLDMPTLEEYWAFRIFMAQMQMSENSYLREIIKQYWHFHQATDQEDNEEVLRNYNEYKLKYEHAAAIT